MEKRVTGKGEETSGDVKSTSTSLGEEVSSTLEAEAHIKEEKVWQSE